MAFKGLREYWWIFKLIMMTILFQQIRSDSLNVLNNSNESLIDFSFWFWVALLEFVIILYLFRRKRKMKNLSFEGIAKEKIKVAQSTEIDMDNLINSISSSKELYKKLIKVCHPDKFVNTDKQILAEKISQEISKNKRNFKVLNQLKLRAEKELKIHI